MTFSATYYGSSGWLLEFGDFRILVDPWLTGTLSFPPGPWLIEGKLPSEQKAPENLDLILLTQGLADHAHPPTLETLPKSIPLVGSRSAVSLAESLGFEKVSAIKPGEALKIKDLSIEASAGAPVPNIENGYVLTHPMGSIYLEPHGFLDKKLSARKLDAVITPVVNITLPLVGAFLKGKDTLPELINRFNPLTILASTTGGDAMFTGILSNLMKMEGSSEEASISINKSIMFIDPKQGNKYQLKTSR